MPESPPAERQFIAVQFRSGDKRTYTYHNDGPPVGAGQQVKVPDRSGDGRTRATVVEIGVPAPTKFATKGILGLIETDQTPEAAQSFLDGLDDQ